MVSIAHPRALGNQLEYSRNLLFRSGHQLEQVFQGLMDRTRSPQDFPHLRTIFDARNRPFHHRDGRVHKEARLVGSGMTAPTEPRFKFCLFLPVARLSSAGWISCQQRITMHIDTLMRERLGGRIPA